MVQISCSFWEAPQRLALTKQADVDLLQGVDAAELVELVVHLVEDQSFVVICGEVLHDVVNCGGENEMNVERLSRGAVMLRRLQMGEELIGRWGVKEAGGYLLLEPGSSPPLSGQSKSSPLR